MRRRDFISVIGSAVVWPPLAAHAQQEERVRRIGVLLPTVKDDPAYKEWLGAFLQRLQQLGWTLGRNLEVDVRWAPHAAETNKQAAELAAVAPNVILAHGAAAVASLLEATRTVPIVFPVIADPVAAGYVDSLARPGGNATGFMIFEYSISGKWLELLKQIAPSVTRVGVIADSAVPTGPAQFGAIQAAASSLGVQVNSLYKRDGKEIEDAITAFARAANGGLIVTPGGPVRGHRGLIVTLAARYKLPAVYFDRAFVADGGLLSYGPDRIDLYQRAAGYVDRILRGEKPADMPVQAPTKYQLVINLKTAKALGLTLPPTLLASADEVIE